MDGSETQRPCEFNSDNSDMAVVCACVYMYIFAYADFYVYMYIHICGLLRVYGHMCMIYVCRTKTVSYKSLLRCVGRLPWPWFGLEQEFQASKVPK